MNATDDLVQAIREREHAYAAALDRLVENAATDPEVMAAKVTLQEALHLVRCLRRLLRGRTPLEVFDALLLPGNFGKESAIRAALTRLYGPRRENL